MFIVHTTDEIQKLQRAHDQFKATLGEADQEFRAIIGIEQEIVRLIDANSLSREVLNNPYSSLSGNEVRAKWQDVQQLVPRRDSQLQQEMLRQQGTSACIRWNVR